MLFNTRVVLYNILRTLLAPVAQGIEHRFPKPCVAGSNPAGGVNRYSVEEWEPKTLTLFLLQKIINYTYSYVLFRFLVIFTELLKRIFYFSLKRRYFYQRNEA